ncbi:MAG: coenzyme F420-0:L-glutamate ligase [Defluviitaleaceae bacterium]|nr:coenzyme F420-0:L-glutamate ligase [Defluviitaleaceae bacterium]
MRHIGTVAYGIRTPLINIGDDLAAIAADSICQAAMAQGFDLCASDVVGVTEAVVAKAQGNFAHIDHIAADVRDKFGENTVGVVFPIFSRNRFLNILKGICHGAKQVCLLLQLPYDEVGNPIMDINLMDELEQKLGGLISAEEFKRIAGEFRHPFTGVDYIELYGQVSDNISVYLSSDPRDILRITQHVLVAEIHNRQRTKARLIKAGAQTVHTLADILQKPVDSSGYNPDYGVLGSNLSTETELKLFPRDCDEFVARLRNEIEARSGVRPEVMIYGDGAFKDPRAGIWELADPVVSPGHTQRLGGQPDEIKLKLAANQLDANATQQEKQEAMTEIILNKSTSNGLREGTTPRVLADLLGSLCDLVSGSGDKGTPVVLIKGYFDNYASE